MVHGKQRGWWRRCRWVIAWIGLAAAVPLWAPLLARALVVNQPLGKPIAVLADSGDGRFREAARLLETHPQAVALSRVEPENWTERVGAVPRLHEVTRRQLLGAGVAESRIELLATKARNPWFWVDDLGHWMERHPTGEVIVLEDQFASRRMRRILDQRLPDKHRRRVRVLCLVDRRFGVTDWYRSRTGVKAWMFATIDYLHALVLGRPSWRDETWDPDHFERALDALGGAK